jgi:hypothetical protein
VTVDRNEAEGRAVGVDPLEVVQQAPVGIAAHLDPLGQTIEDA